jgi:hypothetical protein
MLCDVLKNLKIIKFKYNKMYILTPFSDNDKLKLELILEELEVMHLPTTFKTNPKHGANHAVKTGVTDQVGARQTLFTKDSKSALRYPHFVNICQEFINSHMPEFKYNSIYINKNTICKPHLDGGNSSNTLLIGLGDYTVGETILHLKKDVEINIKIQSLLFNGSKIIHSSKPFIGTRYSLVFF